MQFHWMMILLLGGLSTQLVLGAEPVSGKQSSLMPLSQNLKYPENSIHKP